MTASPVPFVEPGELKRPLPDSLNRLLDQAHARDKELRDLRQSRPVTASAGSTLVSRSSIPTMTTTTIESNDGKRRPSHLKASRTYDRFEESAQIATETVSGPVRPASVAAPSRLMTSFASSWGFAPPLDASDLQYEIACQFDNFYREEDQIMDPGRTVYPKAAYRPGPLRTLFINYARRDEPSAEARARVGREMADFLGVEGVHTKSEYNEEELEAMESGRGSLVNMTELTDMCEDFNIMPGLLRRCEVILAFKKADKGQAGRAAPNNMPDELCFEEFAEMLVRIALFAFSRPPYHAQCPTPKEKVLAMMTMLDIHTPDTKELRRVLAVLNRIAKERKQRRVQRKAEYVYATLFPPVDPAMHALATADEIPEELIEIITRNEHPDRLPRWRCYSRTSVDCGTIKIHRAGMSTLRQYRVVLRNRRDRPIDMRVSIIDCPFLTAKYSETPLAAGVPRVIELTANFTEEGQFLGHVIINFDDDTEVQIPVFANCKVLNRLTDEQIQSRQSSASASHAPTFVKQVVV